MKEVPHKEAWTIIAHHLDLATKWDKDLIEFTKKIRDKIKPLREPDHTERDLVEAYWGELSIIIACMLVFRTRSMAEETEGFLEAIKETITGAITPEFIRSTRAVVKSALKEDEENGRPI